MLGPRRWLFCGVLASLSLWGAPPARAADASEKAAAEALFDEGVDLLKQGKLESACAKLESSQKIDPGVGTLLYLADCYEKRNLTASAWATFREAASTAEARGDDRAGIASERAERLTPRLSKLSIVMEVGQDTSIAGLEILRDGSNVPKALWGTSIPVDPGEHVILARAPGYESEEVHVIVEGESAVATLTVPRLRKMAVTTEPEAAVPTSKSEAADPGKTQRLLGIGLGTAGIVGLGVGAVFGGLAIAKNNETLDPNGDYACTATGCPTQGGIDATNTALTFATVADVGLIAGGVLLAAGVTLYLTAPRARETVRLSPLVSTSGASLSLTGAF